MTDHQPPTLDLETAAEELVLPPAAVAALAESGYLAARRQENGHPRFDLADLKAFAARNADNGTGGNLLHLALSTAPPGPGSNGRPPVDGGHPDTDLQPQELLDLLDQRAEQMALRVLKMFSTVFPDAEAWTLHQQGAFVRRTKERLESVLAVASLGSEVDEELFGDLRRIGAMAARAGAQLPELIVLLRMSRDLVVQNAIDLAENDGRQGGYALSMLLTRVLPAIDRLSDALAEGYWAEMFPS